MTVGVKTSFTWLAAKMQNVHNASSGTYHGFPETHIKLHFSHLQEQTNHWVEGRGRGGGGGGGKERYLPDAFLTEHYKYRMIRFSLDRNDIMGSSDPGIFIGMRFIEIHCDLYY